MFLQFFQKHFIEYVLNPMTLILFESNPEMDIDIDIKVKPCWDCLSWMGLVHPIYESLSDYLSVLRENSITVS